MTPLTDWIFGLLASVPAILRMAWDVKLSIEWRRRSVTASDGGPAEDRCATLVLCTHNDLDALRSIWPLWRGQRFPEGWQVQWVVVNDGSTDGTREWLEGRCMANGKRLTVVHHDKQVAGKKAALAAGILAAEHDRLIFTDADCIPSPDWAANMAAGLGAPDAPPLVLLGFSLPAGGPAILAFDALRIAWQYGSEAAAGRPYMGVGRNLAYRKSHWLRTGGFNSHANLASGDDDLFVQDAIRSGATCVPVSAPLEATCPTRPAVSLADGLQRKRRHLSVVSHYGVGHRRRLLADAALDPAVAAAALAGAAGLLHSGGWIPAAAAGLALTLRAATLSTFARDLHQPRFAGIRALWLGSVRWGLLGVATLSNFTSSPTWTQRAPTRRS